MVTEDEREGREPRKRPAQGMLESLINTTQDAVVFIDAQAKILEFNPAAEWMFGYRAAEVLGEKVNLLMAEPYRAEHDGYIDSYKRTGQAKAIGTIREVTGCRKSGETFRLELSVTELPSGSPVRFAAFLRDVSERVAMQEQLLENERLASLGTASAMLAHEIGNPLNNISLRAQLARRRLKKAGLSEYVEDMDSIKSEIGRLTRLLQEFRSVARRQATDFVQCDLGAICAFVVSEVTHVAQQQSITTRCDVQPSLPAVVGHEDKLKQVMFNLCKNAIEAMPDGGELVVEIRTEDDYVIVRVQDTGTGLPEGNIFELFHTTKPEGTGLGLAVVRQIVAAHRGSMAWDSTPGKGTAFDLRFPKV